MDVSPSAMGATAKIGEDVIEQFGGQSQIYRNTPYGPPYIDQLSDSNIADEAKTEYQSLTSATARQIENLQKQLFGKIYNLEILLYMLFQMAIH